MNSGSSRPLMLAHGIGLVALAVVNLLPPLLILRQAFSPEADSVAWPLRLLPSGLSLENIAILWQAQEIIGHFLLSLWVGLAATAISLALGIPAGWGAARLAALQAWLPRISLASRVLPPIAIAIPLTALLIPAGLYDHPWGLGLVLAHVTMGLPFAVLMAYAAFRELPRELEEAAHVDGCSAWGGFWRVALPGARAMAGGAFILIFLLSWDEFAYALLIQLTDRTMPTLIYYYTEFGQLGAASVMAMLMLPPALVVIALLQRLVAAGAVQGGVKD